MIVDDSIESVKKLDVNAGDLIIIKVKKSISTWDARSIRDKFVKEFVNNKIAVIGEGMDIETLNDEEMKKLGWVHEKN
jgi:hypothetical protein